MVCSRQALEKCQPVAMMLPGAIATRCEKHAKLVWMNTTPTSFSGDSPIWISLRKRLDTTDVSWLLSRQIQVKNTFIHLDDDGCSDSDSESGNLAMHKSESAPAQKSIDPMWISLRTPAVYKDENGVSEATSEIDSAVPTSSTFKSVLPHQSSNLADESLQRGMGIPDMCVSLSRRVPVKNTFVHMEDDGCSDSESVSNDAGATMRKSKSTPAPQCTTPNHCPHFLSDDSLRGFPPKPPGANIPMKLELSLSNLSADERARLPSVGAVLHSSGVCKPCAFFWKAEGCSNGVDCFHCHACSRGEFRRRKRAKRDLHRQARRACLSTKETVAESDADDDSVV